MKSVSRKACGIAASALMLGSMGAGAATTAFAQEESLPAQGGLAGNGIDTPTVSSRVDVAHVRGEFAYTQGEVSPTAAISKAIGAASKYLCGSDFVASSSGEATSAWSIAVKGDVEHSFTATVEELAVDGSAEFRMGCSCLGNPADGTASVNADVSGITIRSIADAAQPDEGVNTIVFASADGYEISLPFDYVMQRYSLLAYNVNGEPLCNSVGGTNQLWLGSTAARYFSRDVVSISFEDRQTPPPAPGSKEAGDVYANVPNVSIVAGGDAL